MADEQRALMAMSTVLLFEELFESMIEQEVQEMGNSDSDDALLLAVLGKGRFPLNRVRIVEYFEVVVPSYSPDFFSMSFSDCFSWRSALHLSREMIPYQAHHHGGRAPVELRKQILTTIWMLTNPECIRLVSDRFDIYRSTCYGVYMQVCTAIMNNLAKRFIHLPEGNDTRNTIQKFEEQRDSRYTWCYWLYHILIQAPLKDPGQYINRKSFHYVQLQVVCDMDMKFIDVFCLFPESVHDARVFRNSPLFVDAERNRDLLFPGNSHLIGDAAYPLKPCILTPYKDTGCLTRQQQHYNFIHSSTQMVVERSLALLKNRFRNLKISMLKQKIKDVPVVVVAACVLHNTCLMNEDDIDDFLDEGDDGSDNGDDDDDDDDDGLYFFPWDTEGEEKRNQIAL